jgi:HKD family nuclease
VYDGRSHGTAIVGSEKAALPPLNDEIEWRIQFEENRDAMLKT